MISQKNFGLSVPAGPPQEVTGEAVSSTGIRLTWAPPLPEAQNGIVQQYIINITEAETGELLNFLTDGMDQLLIVNSLHPYYTYICVIAAYTVGVGPGAYVEVTTDEEGKFRLFLTVLVYHLVLVFYSSS